MRLDFLHFCSWLILQLSDAITAIGAEDFPEKWPDLIPQMVEKMASQNFHIINGVLQTAHSLFKRYEILISIH